MELVKGIEPPTWGLQNLSGTEEEDTSNPSPEKQSDELEEDSI